MMEKDLYTTPDYTLRHSPKAKYLQLRVSPHAVEVIVPAEKYISKSYIRQFLMQKLEWIKKTQQRFQLLVPDRDVDRLPDNINLAALDQVWHIQYCKTTNSGVKIIINPDQQLTVLGNIDNHSQCYLALRHWLKQVAKEHFELLLKKLSIETALSYQRLTIRINSTRWGSCSSRQNISLCCKLLFLPPLLVKHVMLHELCHTKIMNHGASFWRMLAKFDNQATVNAKLLRKAGIDVPSWL